ncbi:MAG: hypothetical protein AAF430_15300 [Myxococcota bacterium]
MHRTHSALAPSDYRARALPRRALVWLLLVALLAAAACGPRLPSSNVLQRLGPGELEAQAETLEARRREEPRNGALLTTLGQVHYLLARDALDREEDQGRYLAHLEKSVDALVSAVEVNPRDDEPHFYLALIDVYRGDSREALRGFRNVKRLHPYPLSYTNLAEIYVYRGDTERAREWNELGLRKGAPFGAVLFNDMLIAWKEGNLRRARRYFADLQNDAPEMLTTINTARLPETPRRFEDFAGYCCGSPGCGPYMRDACKELSLDVLVQERSTETLRRELQLEIERKRRLRKVYEQRKELEIQVEPEPETP